MARTPTASDLNRILDDLRRKRQKVTATDTDERLPDPAPKAEDATAKMEARIAKLEQKIAALEDALKQSRSLAAAAGADLRTARAALATANLKAERADAEARRLKQEAGKLRDLAAAHGADAWELPARLMPNSEEIACRTLGKPYVPPKAGPSTEETLEQLHKASVRPARGVAK